MATKITVKQLGDDVLKLLQSGGGGGSLMQDILSNAACGAAPAGTRFPLGLTFTDFAERLLRKDITPSISTSFTNSGMKEKGTSVNGSTMTLTITNLGGITVPIKEINFYAAGVKINTQPFTAGKATYTHNYPNVINSDITLKAEVVYNGTQSASGTGSFTFVYGSCNFTTNVNVVTSAILQSKLSPSPRLSTNKAFTWDNITLADAKFCYAYPKALGALSSIKDGNGFEQINGYTRNELTITYPTNGDTVQYYVYTLTDAATGSGFKQIYN